MINVKGIVMLYGPQDAVGRIIAPGGNWALPLPITLVRYATDEETGKPMDELHVCGAVQELNVIGAALHYRGQVDDSTEHGAKVVNYMRSTGSIAVAPELSAIAHAMFDLSDMTAQDLLKPTEILDWRLAAVHIVHEIYAPWPETRMEIDK